MIRLVAMAAWVSIVAIVANVGAVRTGLWTAGDPRQRVAAATRLEKLRPRQISVPILRDGRVDGYIVARFAAHVMAPHDVAPGRLEDLIVDEAYRAIHAVNSRDLAVEARAPLTSFVGDIAARVNTRIGLEIVKEIVIEEITVIDKKDARR
jgi:hypothetical protein